MGHHVVLEVGVAGHAPVDADAAVELLGVAAGMLQGRPGALEEDPVLRVRQLSLPRACSRTLTGPSCFAEAECVTPGFSTRRLGKQGRGFGAKWTETDWSGQTRVTSLVPAPLSERPSEWNWT